MGDIGAVGALSLVKCNSARQVVELDLRDNLLDATAARELVRFLKEREGGCVKKMRLGKNRLGNAGTSEFADALMQQLTGSQPPSLTLLDLSENGIKSVGARALIRALVHLKLGANKSAGSALDVSAHWFHILVYLEGVQGEMARDRGLTGGPANDGKRR